MLTSCSLCRYSVDYEDLAKSLLESLQLNVIHIMNMGYICNETKRKTQTLLKTELFEKEKHTQLVLQTQKMGIFVPISALQSY